MVNKLSNSNGVIFWAVSTRSIYKALQDQHTEFIILDQWCVEKNELAFASFQNINKVILTLLLYLSYFDAKGEGQIWWWLCLQFCHGFLGFPDALEELHMVPPPQIDFKLFFFENFGHI